ncbi:MAG: glycosyltransferase, partial [Spirochaetales bacterium]|nr:glycosyltransferase [Spirochaetales bacterium]
RENWEKIEIHIFGTGPQLELLQRVIKKLKVNNRCFFYGSRPHREVLENMNRFNVLLLPSLLYENAPLSIVEAAFSGLRIFVSDWGGIKALSEFCGGEYLVNPESSESINSVLERIVMDITTGAKVERDMEKIDLSFTFGTFIDKHIDLYSFGAD